MKNKIIQIGFNLAILGLVSLWFLYLFLNSYEMDQPEVKFKVIFSFVVMVILEVILIIWKTYYKAKSATRLDEIKQIKDAYLNYKIDEKDDDETSD